MANSTFLVGGVAAALLLAFRFKYVRNYSAMALYGDSLLTFSAKIALGLWFFPSFVPSVNLLDSAPHLY